MTNYTQRKCTITIESVESDPKATNITLLIEPPIPPDADDDAVLEVVSLFLMAVEYGSQVEVKSLTTEEVLN